MTILLKFRGWSWVIGCAYRWGNWNITLVLMSLPSSTPINMKGTGYETISILCVHNFQVREAWVSLLQKCKNASKRVTFVSIDKWKILNLNSRERTQFKPRCTKDIASNYLQFTWMVYMWNENKSGACSLCLDLGPISKVFHAYVIIYTNTLKSKMYQSLKCFWSQAFLSMGYPACIVKGIK